MRSLLKTEPNKCYWCGCEGTTALHHAYPGNPRRRMCTEDGLVVFLCVSCHERVHAAPNEAIDLAIKQDAELAWLNTYSNSRDDFIARYGRNYL